MVSFFHSLNSVANNIATFIVQFCFLVCGIPISKEQLALGGFAAADPMFEKSIKPIIDKAQKTDDRSLQTIEAVMDVQINQMLKDHSKTDMNMKFFSGVGYALISVCMVYLLLMNSSNQVILTSAEKAEMLLVALASITATMSIFVSLKWLTPSDDYRIDVESLLANREKEESIRRNIFVAKCQSAAIILDRLIFGKTMSKVARTFLIASAVMLTLAVVLHF